MKWECLFFNGAAKNSYGDTNELQQTQNEGYEDCGGRRRYLALLNFLNCVSSVGIEGTHKVVVTGDEVDLVKLARSLKKEFGHVTLPVYEAVYTPSQPPCSIL
ncbi:hypothetical protein SADUNF_Sadunf16G0248800 [Salix dunnii]|uniref:Uncharacterized protein n=1 Tax=Salix dunnii TaxID=1413687 RepID=A0A835JDZ7_9ROSI|nr:hypothetical protein SADUNF_Sadunf16G0248800 [Salix dunnii]